MPQPSYYIPPVSVQLPDGSTLIKPGKAILRVKPSDAEKMTGIKMKVLHALAECGLISRATPAPRVTFYYPAEIEAFIARTVEDPAFWDTVKTAAYLKGESLTTSKTRTR